MRSPTLYLEDITNSTCDSEIPSSVLFLDLPDSSIVLPSSFFDESPDPVARSFSQSQTLPSEESSPSTCTTTAKPKKTNSCWSIPNEERPRRFRARHYCSKCLVDFTDKIKLAKHMIEDHQISHPLECEVCGRSFRSPLNLNRHKRLHETEPPQHRCDQCDYVSHQKSNLTLHKRRHAKDYAYTCETCGAGFMERTKFQEHQALHTTAHVGSHRCKHCRRIFCYRRNLTQHLRDRHPETLAEPVEVRSRLSCAHCDKTFVRERNLQRHVLERHSRPAEASVCGECDAVLSCKSTLAQHLRSHRGEKVAMCDDCGKSFAKWQNLRTHQRIHTGERPYACEYCDRAFTQRTTLVLHTRIHTGERPYKCDQCDKAFVSNALLKKHTRKHEKKV